MKIKEIRQSIKKGVRVRCRVPLSDRIIEDTAICEVASDGVFIVVNGPQSEISVYDVIAIQINGEWVNVIS